MLPPGYCHCPRPLATNKVTTELSEFCGSSQKFMCRRKKMRVGPEKNQATTSGISITVLRFFSPPGKAGLISPGEHGAKFEGSMRQLQWVCITVFRAPFLPNQYSHFKRGQGWEFNLWCNSATFRMRLWVWFSGISALQLQGIKVSFKEDIETFRALMQCWSIDELIPFFSHLVQCNLKQPISLYLVLW